MKPIFKFCTVAVIIISVTFTGCSSSKKTEQDRNKVVAVVNGENILKGEVLDEYNNEKGNYGITTENEDTEEYKKIAASLKSSILENLIYSRLTMQKAREAGYKVTDEILKNAKTEFNEILKNVEDQYKLQDTSGSTDYAKKAQEYVNEQLKQLGKTQDEYIEMMAEQTVAQNFENKTIGEIQVSDKEIKDYYDSELKTQKNGTSTDGVQLYTSPGVRVKHILIKLPDTVQTQFNKLFNEQKTDEAEKYLQEQLKKIYPKANEVLNKVKKGEDFEKLIEEYGEDPGMVDNEEGYTVRRDGEYAEEFESAALKLKAGQTSGLVSTIYGYHIIKAYEVIGEKVYTLKEKKDAIKQAITTEKKDEKWQSILDDWLGKASVKKYEELL